MDHKIPSTNNKFACGSTKAHTCFSLVSNFEGTEDDNDVRYSYARRGCSFEIKEVPTVSSIFFERYNIKTGIITFDKQLKSKLVKYPGLK